MRLSHKLDQEIENTILAAIRQGAWLQDAFRIAGIPDSTWRRWMDPALTRGRFYNFQTKVKQAQAQARFLAAQAVKKEDPFKWLANGPGRDQPGEPGWASMTNPHEPTDNAQTDPMQFPDFVKFVNNVRIVMALFPEARRMLDELQAEPTIKPIPQDQPSTPQPEHE
jgi:hypothetical protein